ncbi:MAG TPA: VOC family protein [Planctomycetota bacterium]|jgi:catechol 2,3-dioxygenase-like lactoylglutathione lyase family enzyme
MRTRRAFPRKTRRSSSPFDRYSFVAVTARDLGGSRTFWVDQLGLSVTEEEAGRYFIVDAGGLRLCVDTEDGDIHKAGSTDPVIGLKVSSLEKTLRALEKRGVRPSKGPVAGRRGAWAVIRDPDGRAVVLTEAD